MPTVVAGLLLGLAWGAGSIEAQALKVAVPLALSQSYQALVGDRPASSVKDFRGLTRDLVELTLLRQAFERSGIPETVDLVVADSFDRIRAQVVRGEVLMPGTLWWLDELADDRDRLWVTRPVLASGETVWGIYGLAENPRLKAVRAPKDLAGLTALTDPSWTRDVRTLTQLGVRIQGVKVWANLKKMLVGGRADFTLLPFASTPDMAVTWEGVKVTPIPGLKVGIPGARGFVVTKAWPGSEAVFRKLDAALGALAASGAVGRAFQQAGFIHDPRIADWTLVAVD